MGGQVIAVLFCSFQLWEFCYLVNDWNAITLINLEHLVGALPCGCPPIFVAIGQNLIKKFFLFTQSPGKPEGLPVLAG